MAATTSGIFVMLIFRDLSATNNDMAKLIKKLKPPISTIPIKVKIQSAKERILSNPTKATPKVPAEKVICLISISSPKNLPIINVLPKKNQSEILPEMGPA